MNNLTGKAKEQLNTWYQNNPVHYYEDTPNQLEFGKLDIRCQWGIIQDWADSVGYELSTRWNVSLKLHFAYVRDISYYESRLPWSPHNTRQEARSAAIEKLNEIINEAFKQVN